MWLRNQQLQRSCQIQCHDQRGNESYLNSLNVTLDSYKINAYTLSDLLVDIPEREKKVFTFTIVSIQFC